LLLWRDEANGYRAPLMSLGPACGPASSFTSLRPVRIALVQPRGWRANSKPATAGGGQGRWVADGV